MDNRKQEFIVYPAIDLRGGKVVRLAQGDPNAQKAYSDQPQSVAENWLAQGAEWLHVVNLDGAFDEPANANQTALNCILEACKGKAQVQFGGGLRTLEAVAKALEMGIARVVIGTAAIEDPQFALTCLQDFDPQQIAFGLDARQGVLKTRGWQQDSGLALEDFASFLKEVGACTLIYTDIARDGMESGVDLENTRQLAHTTGLRVIASGGVATLEDIRNIKQAGLDGVITGRALYENQFTLEEALAC